MKSIPNWQSLLEDHTANFHIALTIPFLLGGQQSPDLKAPVRNDAVNNRIYNLLFSFMDDCPENHTVWIYRCPDLSGEPAVRLLHPADELPKDVCSIDFDATGRPRLVVSRNLSGSSDPNIQSITDMLTSLLSPALTKAHFSYSPTQKKYCVYPDEEIERIKACLA